MHIQSWLAAVIPDLLLGQFGQPSVPHPSLHLLKLPAHSLVWLQTLAMHVRQLL